MDFLDPRKRKKHELRLMVGYSLMAVAIGLISLILIYGAYGYGINTKNGQIIQNGLLFVDSHPPAAQVYLAGQYRGVNTAARLILTAGKYTLTIKKAGYRDWSRDFNLQEHSIARFTYPFLFPEKPRTTSLHNYSAMPNLITQSPDQHWLLVQNPDVSKLSFDAYDTTSPSKAPQILDAPSSLLSGGISGHLALVEWSTDNKNVLLKHTFSGGSEFVVFNRAKPADSFNINKTFNFDPTSVYLKNKKIDQLYIYDKAQGTLSLGSTSSGSLKPVLSEVLSLKPFGNNLILFVTDKDAAPGEVLAKIWDSGQAHKLYEFPAGAYYLIDLARYSGHWYYVAGSSTSARVNIYKDPLNDIKNPAINRAVPLLSLNLSGANKVSFSDTGEYVEADDGRSFSVFDILNQETYAYKLNVSSEAPLVWMDGSRLIGKSDGQIYVIDYDATNAQIVAPTAEANGGYFSRDYNRLFTVQSGRGVYRLVNIDMRAGSDLPKTISG